MMRRRTKHKKRRHGRVAKGLEQAADFSFGLSRVAVSQICRSVGFRYAQSSVVETLTLVATKYLQTFASTAASLSNAANRTESNIFDVVNALHDLQLPLGLPGGSAVLDLDGTKDCLIRSGMLRDLSESNIFNVVNAVHNLHLPLGFFGGSAVLDLDETKSCLIRSGILRDLSDFVGSTPEIPFAKPVPRNLNRSENVIEACQATLSPRRTHVPNWLPDFPAASTYEERSLPPRSEELWENSDFARKCHIGENSGISSYSGSSGGCLPGKRKKVRFKLGGNATVNGGECKGGNRFNANGCWSEESNYHKEGRLRMRSEANGFGDTELELGFSET